VIDSRNVILHHLNIRQIWGILIEIFPVPLAKGIKNIATVASSEHRETSELVAKANTGTIVTGSQGDSLILADLTSDSLILADMTSDNLILADSRTPTQSDFLL